MKLCLRLILLFDSIYFLGATTYYLQPNQRLEYDPNKVPLSKRNDIQIYCYEGKPKFIIYIWQSVSLHLDHKSDNFIQYDGQTPEDVQAEYEARRSSWSFSLFSAKQKHFNLDPFNQSCVGIESSDKYSVYLNVVRINYWQILLLLSGILLFVSAPKICNNPLFYYICGISLGICASFLILIYFISKLLPQRPMMYGFIVGGWTVGVYLLQILWENFRVICTTYKAYVLWYTFITGLISFVICYRLGPISNPRSKNLIQWTFQSLALIMIFYSSHFQEAAMGFVVLLLLCYNIPRAWISKSRTYWKKKFPPKIQLLNNDEYYQQGVKETSKALKELREHCSSPNCNQWKTVLRLQNVKRFASFVEGSSHLSDQEMLDYEDDSFNRTELTDDEAVEDYDISSDEDY